MKPAVKKQKDAPKEFFIPEGCYITELVGVAEDPQLSIAVARVPPGVTTRWHRLKGTAERYVILSGTGRMEVGQEPPTDMGPGDVALIPPQTPMRIINTGPDDLRFYCLCTPAFVQSCYEEIKETTDERR